MKMSAPLQFGSGSVYYTQAREDTPEFVRFLMTLSNLKQKSRDQVVVKEWQLTNRKGDLEGLICGVSAPASVGKGTRKLIEKLDQMPGIAVRKVDNPGKMSDRERQNALENSMQELLYNVLTFFSAVRRPTERAH